VTATPAPPLDSGSDHRFLDGARRTSFVVLGVWAAARLAETGFALWVRHTASSPPRDRAVDEQPVSDVDDAGR
jgi:hypothetical protein